MDIKEHKERVDKATERWLLLTIFIIFAVMLTLSALKAPKSFFNKYSYKDNLGYSNDTDDYVKQAEELLKSGEVNNGKININLASLETLKSLTGIGDVKAQAIIDYRNQNGNFKTIDEVLNVKGIGEKTFDKIKDAITV